MAGPDYSVWDALFQAPWRGMSTPGTPAPNPLAQPPAAPATPGPVSPEMRLINSIFELPKLGLFDFWGQSGADQPNWGPNGPPEGATSKDSDPSIEEQKKRNDQTTDPATNPVLNPDATGGGAMGQFGGLGAVLNDALPNDMVKLPSGVVGENDAIRAALLQGGLSLMAPSWGNPLSQLGQAIGQGAEAFTRTSRSGERDVAQALGVEKAKADVGESKAKAEYYREAGESSKTKRLKEKTPSSTEFERLAASAGLGAKGSIYLKDRLKNFDAFTDNDADLDPAARILKWLDEAKGLDNPAKGPNVGGTETVQATEVKGVPKVGDIRSGYKFKGGDPADQKNWEKVK